MYRFTDAFFMTRKQVDPNILGNVLGKIKKDISDLFEMPIFLSS